MLDKTAQKQILTVHLRKKYIIVSSIIIST